MPTVPSVRLSHISLRRLQPPMPLPTVPTQVKLDPRTAPPPASQRPRPNTTQPHTVHASYRAPCNASSARRRPLGTCSLDLLQSGSATATESQILAAEASRHVQSGSATESLARRSLPDSESWWFYLPDPRDCFSRSTSPSPRAGAAPPNTGACTATNRRRSTLKGVGGGVRIQKRGFRV